MPGAGIIVMWHGTLAHIPPGWTLCDGTFGTPDLRERFIRGTPDGVDPGDLGGDSDHTHNWVDIGHVHEFQAGAVVAGGSDIALETTSTAPSGTTTAGDNEPPYYNLAFVMKL